MELRHLRHFVALAEERNFTRAAERELIVQSGLSSSVRALEREVGADLFVRGSRPVRLTAEGRALLPAARRTLESAEAARQAVQDVRGLLSGHLRIGTYPINPRLLPLPALLLAFARAHPALDVSVRQIPGLSTAAKVADGELDCALFDQVGPPAPGLRAIPLISEEFQVAVPSAHPWPDAAPSPSRTSRTSPSSKPTRPGRPATAPTPPSPKRPSPAASSARSPTGSSSETSSKPASA